MKICHNVVLITPKPSCPKPILDFVDVLKGQNWFAKPVLVS